MEFYEKLSKSIVFSSLWAQCPEFCKIWITLISLKDEDHIVSQNITGIARLACMPVDMVARALEFFQQPDPNSTSKDHGGRRVLKVDRGYFLVNGEKYRELCWSDAKKEYERQRKRAQRERKQKEEQARTQPPPVDSESKAKPDPQVELKFPESLDTPEFRAAWDIFVAHRIQKRSKLTPQAAAMQLKKLAAMGPARAISALEHTISQGYTGVYEAKDGGQKQLNLNHPKPPPGQW